VFTRLIRIAMLALLGCLSACATNNFSTTKSDVAGVSIKDTRVYVYSFLDIRANDFGPSLVNEVDTQLISSLAASGVTSKVLQFKQSAVGQGYSLTGGGMTIPIGPTIKANLEDERAFNAKYRLVIFPSAMRLQGAWKMYEVRWDLFDAQTHALVWSGTSNGKHMSMYSNNENPKERAKTIVDSAMAAFAQSKLL
jgi:hypothetical protein